MDNEGVRRIAVIGGGLAGLAAAHRLSELATEKQRKMQITLFDSASRLGGIVGTERIGGYLVDVGADSFLTNKPGAIQLCRRLGIENRLIPTDSRYRGALVLYDGRPIPVPEGFQLLSPTAVWPIMTSPLFSVWGKVRLLMEWFVPRASSGLTGYSTKIHSTLSDESLASFARRRFGREAFERLIQPLVGGIYTADPDRLSMAATIPRFLEMEQEYGSLIRAAMAQRTARPPHGAPSEVDQSSGARYGMFAGLAGGMEDLLQALRTRVETTCTVCLNSPVKSVTQDQPVTSDFAGLPSTSGYILTLADLTRQRFDGVIVATSAPQAARIFTELSHDLTRELIQIEHASSALVVTGHQLADIRHPLNAFGLVIPHVERRRLLAVSFSSRKFPTRAPHGRVLLRTFIGGAMQPELYEHSDAELIEITRTELADCLGVRGEPDFSKVYRYPQAMPQYHVGHLDRIARIEVLIIQHPQIAIAGNAYHGVGVPDTITSGEQAAERIV